jgi:hypothetical protein
MKRHWAVRIWEEGHNFDFWHVNHFLAGILMAGLVSYFNINLLIGFLASLFLMIGWEVFETAFGVIETRFNMYFDVIFSVISFWLTIFLKYHYLSETNYNTVLFCALILYIILGLWGFWAYKIRTGDQN